MSALRLPRWLDVSILWIAAVILLAWLFPEGGAKSGPLQAPLLMKAGIIWIFFGQGVQLGWRNFLSGAGEWRVHLFVQLFSFVFAPLSLLLLDHGPFRIFPDGVRLGFLFLAMLPTTLSTSALMAERAGGRVASVSWNILISNLLGVFLVPLWTLWLLQSRSGVEIPKAGLLINLGLQLLLPMVSGMLLQSRLQDFWSRHRIGLRRLNMFFIYLMVYAAICDGLVSRSWESLDVVMTLFLGIAVLVVLLFWHGSAWWMTGKLGMPTALRIAAVFTAAQKTLAAGVPMAGILFIALEKAGEVTPPLALFLLPLLFYHPLQLMLGAVMVGRMQVTGDR